MKYPAAQSTASRGFTLIEMLVAITIMTLIMGIGIASYQRFNEKQLVTSAATQLVSSLRQMQKKITVGDKPTGCVGTLQGYILRANAQGYAVYAQCNAEVQVDTKTLSGITVSPAIYTVRFSDLGRNVTITNGPSIVLSTTLFSNTIQVTSTGEIIDGGIQAL